MANSSSSIRQKITLGYILSIAVIIGGAIFSYGNIRMIENKIMVVSNIFAELFETTLEIRRFEKNYFLYKEEKDYVELLRFVNNAGVIIQINREKLEGLASRGSVLNLERALDEYRKLIVENKAALQRGDNAEDNADYRVRRKGRELVEIAEGIVNIERIRIQALLSRSQRLIIIFTFSLVVIGIGFGYVLLRTVTVPLKLLEETMGKISSGQMERISINSRDKEVVLFSDAFNKMLRELELKQMRFVAQSDKLASLGTMVSGVAHQINNPLSNISTSCQILHEEIEEHNISYKKELLQQIEEQVGRAKAIVYSLLEFSKKKEFKREPYPLKELIEEAIRLVQGEVPAGVEIKMDIPGDIWNCVDKQRIQQAILNIIKNGVDAIPDEGKVLVSAREDTENKTVEIKIQDTGLGIDSENIERIFDPFFTTKGDKKGTGLGLFVASEIVKEHEGRIEVDSTAGEGTTFTIKLPVKEI